MMMKNNGMNPNKIKRKTGKEEKIKIDDCLL
jgi:hypothetical protein